MLTKKLVLIFAMVLLAGMVYSFTSEPFVASDFVPATGSTSTPSAVSTLATGVTVISGNPFSATDLAVADTPTPSKSIDYYFRFANCRLLGGTSCNDTKAGNASTGTPVVPTPVATAGFCVAPTVYNPVAYKLPDYAPSNIQYNCVPTTVSSKLPAAPVITPQQPKPVVVQDTTPSQDSIDLRNSIDAIDALKAENTTLTFKAYAYPTKDCVYFFKGLTSVSKITVVGSLFESGPVTIPNVMPAAFPSANDSTGVYYKNNSAWELLAKTTISKGVFVHMATGNNAAWDGPYVNACPQVTVYDSMNAASQGNAFLSYTRLILGNGSDEGIRLSIKGFGKDYVWGPDTFTNGPGYFKNNYFADASYDIDLTKTSGSVVPIYFGTPYSTYFNFVVKSRQSTPAAPFDDIQVSITP